MKRVAVTLVILLACACKSEPPKPVPVIDRAKFEPLYRSGKSIQGAMDVGLNRLKLTELLQALATEVSIAKDKANTEKERTMIAKYDSALAAYQAGEAVLEALDGNERTIYGFVGQPDTLSFPHLVPVVQKYSLKLTTERMEGKKSSIDIEYLTMDTVRGAWQAAGKLMDEANKAYYAEEVPTR